MVSVYFVLGDSVMGITAHLLENEENSMESKTGE